MPPPLRRRSLLAGSAASLALPLAAQPRTASRALALAQVVDGSAREQEIARDFLVGARVALQDANARGGLRGRPVEHVAIETDGGANGLQDAWRSVRDNAACVALFGTVSDPVAASLAALLQRDGADIAHVAPWLQDGAGAVDERTFPIFAGRQQQIAHALRSLTVGGMRQIGVVYASAREAGLYRAEITATAASLKLSLAAWTADGDPAALAQRLGPASPALLLFVGGTPELVRFTHGLARHAGQRYVVALADVNVQTVQQTGPGRATPVIATQVVPMVTSALPVVRHYREALARLFDEPPVALGLAGFIAARYTLRVLEGLDGPITRASALAAFQRRADVDVGGYRVRFDDSGRSAAFVTQSMLTADGRVVG